MKKLRYCGDLKMKEDENANNDEHNLKNDYLDTTYDFKGLCPYLNPN